MTTSTPAFLQMAAPHLQSLKYGPQLEIDSGLASCSHIAALTALTQLQPSYVNFDCATDVSTCHGLGLLELSFWECKGWEKAFQMSGILPALQKLKITDIDKKDFPLNREVQLKPDAAQEHATVRRCIFGLSKLVELSGGCRLLLEMPHGWKKEPGLCHCSFPSANLGIGINGCICKQIWKKVCY